VFGLFVAVGSVAQTLDNERLNAIWPSDAQCNVFSELPDVKIARFMPRSFTQDPGFVWSKDRKFAVCVDGYILTNKVDIGANLTEHIRSFANTCSEEGFSSALKSIISGTYTLVVVDITSSRCCMTNDHVGSLPLYYSKLNNGWLLSTNPVALAQTGLINTDIDLTSCAEWIYIGCTIGDRQMLKGIKLVHPYTSFKWDSGKAQTELDANDDSPWDILPIAKSPTADQLADSFIEGCRRLSTIDSQPAHFQSSGKDSRLILASWPDSFDPPCYTYGDPESLEVHLARSITDLRGSKWIHVWLDGDEVAENLINLFNASGMIIWPDRYFSARQMQKDGHTGVTDGYWGGIQIHPGGYDCDRYFSLFAKIARFATVFVDHKISAIGFDYITEKLFEYMLQTHGCQPFLNEFVSADFVTELEKHKPQIQQDINNELKRLVPQNDSLAILWRKFISSNRGPHQHAQQGVMCRSFVNIYYPHCSDLDHHRMQLKVKPGVSAYDRQYIEIYRRRFPDYADLPYGTTLLPLRTSAFRTKLANILIGRGWHIPLLTGNTHGRERDANSWGAWLRKSQSLRENAAQLLRDGGIIDEKNIANTFKAIASGAKAGTGQVFHLASIGKWISMSGKNL